MGLTSYLPGLPGQSLFPPPQCALFIKVAKDTVPILCPVFVFSLSLHIFFNWHKMEGDEVEIVYVNEDGGYISSAEEGGFCPQESCSDEEEQSAGFCPDDSFSGEESEGFCPDDSSSSSSEGFCPEDNSSEDATNTWKGTVDALVVLSEDSDSSEDVFLPEEKEEEVADPQVAQSEDSEDAFLPQEKEEEAVAPQMEEEGGGEEARMPSEQPMPPPVSRQTRRLRVTDRIGAIVNELPLSSPDIPDKAPQQPQRADQRCIAIVEELERLAKDVVIHDAVGNSMSPRSLRDLFVRASKSPTHAEAVRHFLIQAKRKGQGFPWIEPMPRFIEEDFMTPPDPDRPWETLCTRGIICQVYQRTSILQRANRTQGVAFVGRSFVPCNVRALHMELENMTLELRALSRATPVTREIEHRMASLKATIEQVKDSLPQDRLTCTLCHLWDLNKYGIQKPGKKQQAIQWFHHLFEVMFSLWDIQICGSFCCVLVGSDFLLS